MAASERNIPAMNKKARLEMAEFIARMLHVVCGIHTAEDIAFEAWTILKGLKGVMDSEKHSK